MPIIILFYFTYYFFIGGLEEKIIISFRSLIGFLIVFFMFFHIRIFDDIKDYKKDIKSKKSKYFLDITKMKKLLLALVIIQIFLLIFLSIEAALLYFFLLIFSIGIYYNFFIDNFLSKRVFLNNLLHQFFIILLGLFIFTIYHLDFINISYDYLIFVINMYFVFAFFEICRKIKKQDNELFAYSYANIFGKLKFTVLSLIFVITIGLFSLFSLYSLNSNNFLFNSILIFVTIISIVFLVFSYREIISYKLLKILLFLFLFIILMLIILGSINDNLIVFETGKLVISI